MVENLPFPMRLFFLHYLSRKLMRRIVADREKKTMRLSLVMSWQSSGRAKEERLKNQVEAMILSELICFIKKLGYFHLEFAKTH